MDQPGPSGAQASVAVAVADADVVEVPALGDESTSTRPPRRSAAKEGQKKLEEALAGCGGKRKRTALSKLKASASSPALSSQASLTVAPKRQKSGAQRRRERKERDIVFQQQVMAQPLPTPSYAAEQRVTEENLSGFLATLTNNQLRTIIEAVGRAGAGRRARLLNVCFSSALHSQPSPARRCRTGYSSTSWRIWARTSLSSRWPS